MKKLTAVVLISLLVLGSVFAGGAKEEETKTVQYKDVVVCADGSQITSCDPHNVNNIQHNRLFKCSHNTLVSSNSATGTYEPELATSWEWLSDTEIVFHLRNDVKFSNGEPFTAKDVAWTFERAKVANTVSTKFSGILDHSEVIDDYTIKLVLCAPNVDWLDTLSLPLASILCQKAIEADPLNGPGVGTGMWKITELEEGDHVHLVKNEYWWGEDTPTKELEIRYMGEASARLIALQNGEVDVCISPASTEVQFVIDDPNLELIERPGSTCCYFAFNTSKGPGSDKNLRLAMAHAIDFEDVLIGAASGEGSIAVSNWGPSTYGYYDGFGPYTRDLELAKQYLAKSQYKTITVSVKDAARLRAAQIIQANCKEIGLEVVIEELEAAALTAKTKYTSASHEAMIYTMGWNDFGDDGRRAYYKNSNTNKAVLYDEKVMELIDLAVKCTDDTQRKAYYAEVQTMNHDNAWYIPLYYSKVTVAVNKGVSGVIWEGHQSHDYSNIVVEL